MSHWGTKETDRKEVIAFLREKHYDENILHTRLSAFGGVSANDFAYTHGWSAVMYILKRIFE